MDITWKTKTVYILEDVVLALNEMWICVKPHTSDIFGNDYHNKYWVKYV